MTDSPPEPAPRWWEVHTWKRWKLAIAVVAALGLYYAVNLLGVVQAGRSDYRHATGAIVVLGAAQYDGVPSPQLEQRLAHALDLYEAGQAPYVMVTGGKLAGDRFTEAAASARWLTDRGVPAEAILREDAGTNTFNSLESAAEVLASVGVDEVVLVTDPFHAKRTELIAAEVGLDAHSSPTPSSVVTGWTSVERHLVEAGGVAVGRVIGFERLSGLTG